MGELRKIPGIGPNIEADLEAIGIHSIADLRGKDPEELYRLDCLRKGYRRTAVSSMSTGWQSTMPKPPTPTRTDCAGGSGKIPRICNFPE